MAGGIDWFRWHHGSVTDPKFGLVAKRAKANRGDVITIWAHLLEQASQSTDRGAFGAIDCDSIDLMLDCEEGTTAAVMVELEARGMTHEGRIAKWEERQPKREDDTAAERKRRQREREHEIALSAGVTGDASRNVTQQKPDVTQGHDREEESRGEKNTPSDEGVSRAQRSASRGSRLPDSWALPMLWGQWALSEYPHWSAETVRLIAAGFADHWHGKAGKDGRKADWEATWRNWCRSDITQRAHPPPNAIRVNGFGLVSKQAALEQRNRAVIDEYLRETDETH